jgi:hypothetical protein
VEWSGRDYCELQSLHCEDGAHVERIRNARTGSKPAFEQPAGVDPLVAIRKQ